MDVTKASIFNVRKSCHRLILLDVFQLELRIRPPPRTFHEPWYLESFTSPLFLLFWKTMKCMREIMVSEAEKVIVLKMNRERNVNLKRSDIKQIQLNIRLT